MGTLTSVKIPRILLVFVTLFLVSSRIQVCYCQDGDDGGEDGEDAPETPPGQDDCNGIFLTYNFNGREKEYPRLKNATAQAWAFKAVASILNAGSEELKAWRMFVGFHNREILVSATGATIVDGTDFPAAVGNGTTFVGNPMVDLKTAAETAGDINQISVQIEITGTQFGVKPPQLPMPKQLKLVNDGWKCPGAKRKGGYMHVCCKKDPKFKVPKVKATKFAPRQWGDLSISYDILQAYSNNYLAQVTLDNINPLGHFDHWNLTWEWQNGEFIQDMRGAFTYRKDYSACIYGAAGKYYKDFDFSNVMNCEKRPYVSDMPADRANDTKLGKIPYCCRNGSLLPSLMDPNKARSIFQMTVFKLPPYDNRTALVPPVKWQIKGVLVSNYRCGPPIRVDPTEFPDPSGLLSKSNAVATWQVVCNMTRPEKKKARCCVSFSAYYNESVIPCSTCACGCPDTDKCNPNARAMLLPSEALLVPFVNRTAKAKAWASIKKRPIPKPLPCPDNCGVSINWHINSDYTSGWTARMTLFNWEDFPFEDWYTAVRMDKAFAGYENVYSFNGTKVIRGNKVLFFQGLKDMNYLVGETNGTDPKKDPRVPGKQQSVISFTKQHTPGINIQAGDGFPTRVYFNGEECALPTVFPIKDSAHKSPISFLLVLFIAVMSFMMMQDQFR
ncbi:hypothetical protein JRO89_XS15G0149400 [Xanthoceras sorbifolium]|uniref:COBRA C-terminal domain-containing protein n=1 Tax=Xanthoceras sorbifolium TaxID=99658 RepID=A0ABQ8H296_9ROSI|nr:hypothetical protein JRO89_XS15G0149400 [Xanthoceras sorbifolium]